MILGKVHLLREVALAPLKIPLTGINLLFNDELASQTVDVSTNLCVEMILFRKICVKVMFNKICAKIYLYSAAYIFCGKQLNIKIINQVEKQLSGSFESRQ